MSKPTTEEQELLAAVARERDVVQASLTPDEALQLADLIIGSPAMMFETQQRIFALAFRLFSQEQTAATDALMKTLGVLCQMSSRMKEK